MATSKEIRDSIVLRLSAFGFIRTRAMMGEYLVYYNEKHIGGIYDDKLLIKPTQTNAVTFPDKEFIVPYPGAKPMLHCPLDLPDETIAKILQTSFLEL